MSFSKLKKNRQKVSALAAEAEKVSGGKKNFNDDRFWSPTVDKVGNGYAVIRFLPAPEGNDVPWIQYWDHGFQGPTGMWYIEKSLTSIGKEDPVGEYNSKLWNEIGTEDAKDQVRKQKRRLHYVANIYVVEDPGNPDNEGKVFLYKFGKKIFDKIKDSMQPEFDDEDPINPFDFWEGANFKLKIRKVEGYRNYDKSEFSPQSEFLGGDDDKLEEIYNKTYDLQEFLDPANYKSYGELKAKLVRVLQLNEDNSSSTDDEDETEDPREEKSEEPKDRKTKDPVESLDDDDDDNLSYFNQLAEEDD